MLHVLHVLHIPCAPAPVLLQGIEIFEVLKQNDAYHALQKVGGLVFTGPTGTNVNDVAIALLG